MGVDQGTGGKSGVRSRGDYLEELERAMLGDDEETPEISEAERLAAHAEPPKRRTDGKVYGTQRERPLTAKQYSFARALIEGKTQEQAYREAYPDAQAKPQVIKSSAWKLSQDPRVQKMLNEHWGETVEALAEDTAATKRFVLKTLLHYVREGKQESTRLRSLELMGKTVGMFSKQEEKEEERVSAEQLKRELAGHLRKLDNIRPQSRAQIIDVSPVPVAVPQSLGGSQD